MKKFKWALAALLLVLLLAVPGCAPAQYRDGIYTAQAANYSANGWRDFVELTVEDGEIVKINWDSTYKDDSIPIRKKQYSKSGLYGMLVTGAIGEWYDQAVAAEQFVLEHGIGALAVKEDGYTDAIAGCTIEVNEFEELLKNCIEQAGV